MFRYVILGLLRDGTIYHGYALMKQYCERSGVQLGSGNFYRELQRLVSEGWVRTVPNPIGADARRAPYAITAEGAGAFDAWLASPLGQPHEQQADELSTRLMFLPDTDAETVLTLLAAWEQELWERSKTLERKRDLALRQANSDRHSQALSAFLARRVKQVTVDIECLAELGKLCEQWRQRAPLDAPRRPLSTPTKSDGGQRLAARSSFERAAQGTEVSAAGGRQAGRKFRR
jgi:DNA-binding PadR family transcriptional regulator